MPTQAGALALRWGKASRSGRPAMALDAAAFATAAEQKSAVDKLMDGLREEYGTKLDLTPS